METLTPEEEARIRDVFDESRRHEELCDEAVKATGIEGKPAGALWWLLRGHVLDPDGDGRTAPEWTQEYVTELAKRIAGDPLLMLVLTAWDIEVRMRNGDSDTDGPVGIAVAPVVSMLSKMDR